MNINKLSLGTKIGSIVIVALLLSGIVLFTFLLINTITGYPQYDITYRDLIYQELTFERYERISQGKSGYAYDIYFREYESPFRIYSFITKKVDKVALSQLDEAKTVQVYLHKLTDNQGEYLELCELHDNQISILSLSDYVKANQSNLLWGVVSCSFFILDCLFLLWMFTRMFKKRTKNNCETQVSENSKNNSSKGASYV